METISKAVTYGKRNCIEHDGEKYFFSVWGKNAAIPAEDFYLREDNGRHYIYYLDDAVSTVFVESPSKKFEGIKQRIEQWEGCKVVAVAEVVKKISPGKNEERDWYEYFFLTKSA